MQYYYEVAPTKIARAGSDTFTYSYDHSLPIGSIVVVELGKQKVTGVVCKKVPQPQYATKPIAAIVEPVPLPEPLLATARWMAAYYATPLALVLQTILPRGIQKTRRERPAPLHVSRRDRTHLVLNSAQSKAVHTIATMTPGTALLHGVTGSGKTLVYIEAAKQTLAAGQSVIILVPEIALTSQLVDEFSHHFHNIILTHSKQTEASRHTVWREALHATEPRVIIGPRSALFMPLPRIGLVVIDEAHEPSFKQEQAPRYSALRVASVLTGAQKGKLVLGSATPLVTDFYTATHTKRPIISMARSARADAAPPTISLVDSTKRHSFKRHRFLSNTLLDAIDTTVNEGNQALMFHNRRGSASTTLCEQCGWIATCSRCFIPFTLHADTHLLRCHICGDTQHVPTSCPVCHHADIIHKGIGTKMIESELRKLYPNKNIVRFDADTLATDTVDKRYKELYDGSIDIIIGTQVIAKGLDLPHLRTVGVVQADAGLSLPDYSAAERTFQLIAQVVGRVGRSRHQTSVIIQSYQPHHPAVIDGIAQNYLHFYEATLAERARAHFPPFTFLMQLTCVYKTEEAAVRNARQLAKTLRAQASSTVDILGPTPSFYERQHDTYRWQLLVKSPVRTDLLALLPSIPSPHWHIELDPISLL